MSSNKRGLGRGLEALLVNVVDQPKPAVEPPPPRQTVEPPANPAVEPPPLPKTLASNPTLLQEAQSLKDLLLELEKMVSQL